jgi:hypothetical protein
LKKLGIIGGGATMVWLSEWICVIMAKKNGEGGEDVGLTRC